ncbi:MAG: NADH-quinone oxidoreductase subunit L [Firmicutes bacterium]|nr:NADH-quinone oxidoreductase subunit L [Bacillota bacterium]
MLMEPLAPAAVSTQVQASALWLIPFLPLFGAIVNGLYGLFCKATNRKAPDTKLVDAIALGTVAVAFLMSVYYFVTLMGRAPADRSITQTLWTWLDLGGARVMDGVTRTTISWAYKFDALSACMALLVTGVGFLIHLFSTGYMADERKDGRYYRFMAYLNLFVFSMLNLVLGSNILMMFLGWEGVGLCSYLLIGFYFDKEAAAIAGKKAFVTNRIGDFGFMVGFFLLFMIFGSLDFDTLMGSVREVALRPELTIFGVTKATTWWFNVAGIALFVGACGKSAQIPLYVWLPDAMAGPTPVSALIHAATMVTSGLYMITRLNFVYANAPLALSVVLAVGALTALVAASMGLAQYDIKKVLAYSTVSQLGFMFMGMGAGAYAAGMFHVFTHAFFKAALFLGSGSVIMACHHEQDMRNMGGLRTKLPKTFWSMLIATLAIAGIFPFSGFFSKDEILWKVFEGWHSGGHTLNLVAWLMGMAAAFMTAFYMVRLMVMTFWGEYRGGGHDPHGLRAPADPHHHDDHGHHDHGHGDHGPKEVAWTMWLPVAILAGLALVAGFLNIPHSLHWLGGSHFSEWIAPLLYQKEAVHAAHEAAPAIEYGLMAWATLVWAPGAMLLAWWIYKMDPSWGKAKAFVAKFPNLYRWVHNKYFVDEFYEWAFIGPCKQLGAQLWAFDAWVVDGIVNGAARVTILWSNLLFWFDARVVDGLVNLVAWLLQQLSGGFRKLQTGRVQNYALVMFLGFLVFAFWKFLA